MHQSFHHYWFRCQYVEIMRNSFTVSLIELQSGRGIRVFSAILQKVSVSAMTHPWHKESRVLCPAILFPIYRGEDSCMLQVSDVVGRRLC